jgi:hypothetical protein
VLEPVIAIAFEFVDAGMVAVHKKRCAVGVGEPFANQVVKRVVVM